MPGVSNRRYICRDARDHGELLIRGPQVMPGYWQRPPMTARALDADGWLHTRLLCTADPDGDFFIAGHLGGIAGHGVLA